MKSGRRIGGFSESNVAYQYWIGDKPPLISLLQDLLKWHSIKSGKYSVCLITSENVEQFCDIPDFFFHLSPAHQADFVRVSVISERGGLWLDSDVLILEDLDVLFRYMQYGNGFFVLENNDTLCNGVFGSKPDTRMMNCWKNNITDLLDEYGANLGWSDLGSKSMYQVLANESNSMDGYELLKGLDTIYPSNWDTCVKDYLEMNSAHADVLKREFQPLLILVNSVYRAVDHMGRSELLSSDTCLGEFLRLSISRL